jgi:hypothetical protein
VPYKELKLSLHTLSDDVASSEPSLLSAKEAIED